MWKRIGVSAVVAAGVVGLIAVRVASDGDPEEVRQVAPEPAEVAAEFVAAEPPATPSPEPIGGGAVKTEWAAPPKELSRVVQSGLAYLAGAQRADGGWSQGGGWRTADRGGRIEGAGVEDPADLGNTCLALLALFRAGNTPTAGPYASHMRAGLGFVLDRVERADADSLYLTDVRNTQLQSKIGPYADTFLAGLVLAELRGHAGDREPRLAAGLEKAVTKIARHQTADGGFAGNRGWAPTLSAGLATKALARARERGVRVDETVLARARGDALRAANGVAARATGEAAAVGMPGARMGGMGGGAAEDAGVELYGRGRGAGNSQDVLNAMRLDAADAQRVLASPAATAPAKTRAAATVEQLAAADAENDRVQSRLAKSVRDEGFVRGFGSNGGEEFLSFLSISEALLLRGGSDWRDWDARMTAGLAKAQDKDGSWQGHHCITGKTFCTSAALLVLLADRTPFTPETLAAARGKVVVR